MSRAVTQDHILFEECVKMFRPQEKEYNSIQKKVSKSFIITSFKVTQEWDLGICRVSPSKEVDLPRPYSGLVSIIENPKWVGDHNPHLFGIALSAIVSFITCKSCKSTRDDLLYQRTDLTQNEYEVIALNNPLLTAGPGTVFTSLSSQRESFFFEEIKSFIDPLFKMEYKQYILVMQSIRMAHLSLINKREDFGLAYLLGVSAIEAIAQKAISREKVKKDNPSEALWNDKAKTDQDFNELLKLYSEARGQNKYLKERFIKFILLYAPVNKWDEYVHDPTQERMEYNKEVNPLDENSWFPEKNYKDKLPSQLTEDDIPKLLDDCYKHRSCFIHRGEQPPHKDPNPNLNRYFQVYRKYNQGKVETTLLPNYLLLMGIFKYSLINWINKKK